MKRHVLPCVLAVVFAAAAFLMQGAAARSSATGAYGDGALEGDVVVSLLGGFRGVAAEVIWFRAERLQDTGRFVELAQLSSLLTRLEPHTPEVWAHAAWNLAYNISVQMPSYEDRWRWVEAGLRLLRDDGIRLNPEDPSLHRELAWMFLAKIGGPIDDAHELYEAKWRAAMKDAIGRSDFSSVRMDPALMRETEAEFGKLDWTDPEASALYWANKGLKEASGEKRAALRRIVYQSLIMLSERDKSIVPRAYREVLSFAKDYPTDQTRQLVDAFRAHFGVK